MSALPAIVGNWLRLLSCPSQGSSARFLEGLVVESVRMDAANAVSFSDVDSSLRHQLASVLDRPWSFDALWGVPALDSTLQDRATWCIQLAHRLTTLLVAGGDREAPVLLERRVPGSQRSSIAFTYYDRALTVAAPPSALLAACRLIVDGSTQYAHWVGKVLRAICEVEGTHDGLVSGSTASAPGRIELSRCNDEVALAETLVHEASHQYAHLAARIDSLEDGTDATLYWSPFRRAYRPLRAILIAYHAFANVILFYDDLDVAGLGGGTVDSTRRSILKRLGEIEPILANSRALTNVGRALFDGVHETCSRRCLE